MLDFQQKRKVRGVMYHKATLIILGLLTLVVLHSTWAVYQKKRESEEMKNISLKNVEELRDRNVDLTAKIERLDTTPGIEEEIRSKFTVAKEQENMVVVVEDTDNNASATTSKKGFWGSIERFFHKK
jgi:cell division protein FtsB